MLCADVMTNANDIEVQFQAHLMALTDWKAGQLHLGSFYSRGDILSIMQTLKTYGT